MSFFSITRTRLRQAELLSGVPLSKEIRRRIGAVTSQLSRAPCLAVVLVGDRSDSTRYVNHKKRAAAECGIEMRILNLPSTARQRELHEALAAVNGDVSVDGVILQLPLPPHLRARPALFHIHPGKDVDGLHPLNAGNLFLQDQSPLIQLLSKSNSYISGAEASAAMTVPDRLADGLTAEVLLLPTHSGGYSALRRRTHESKFFVPCTALAIRSILFSYLGRTESLFHLMKTVHEDDLAKSPSFSSPSVMDTSSQKKNHTSKISQKPQQRDLHAVIVNKSMVVGVPTAALLQRAGGFVVTTCSRSNSLETVRALAKHADVLITAYGQVNVFDSSCVKEGAIIIDAAINEVPKGLTIPKGEANRVRAGAEAPVKKTLCGDVDVASVSAVAAAVTKTPGGVGPLTVSHLMMNVLKAYQLRHANSLYYNNIYTEFLKMYGTYDKVRNYAPSAALAVRSQYAAMPTSAAKTSIQQASAGREESMSRSDDDEDYYPYKEDNRLDDEEADNISYDV